MNIPSRPQKMGHAFSIVFQYPDGHYVANWGQYFRSEDINWTEVEGFARKHDLKVYLGESPHKVGGVSGVPRRKTLIMDREG
jgi:hypothetical protein